MAEEFMHPREAAKRLGIAVATLYDWLSQSDYGLLLIRGERVTIDYLQAGPLGHGRIRIPTAEVERMLQLMRVKPKRLIIRNPPINRAHFPGITVPLGRPTQS